MGSKQSNDRYIILIIGIVLVGLAIFVRLFDLQIIKGNEYKEQAQTRLMRNVSVKAPRGDILDRYGRPLVTNREGFSLVVYKEYVKGDALDDLILKLAHLLEQYDCDYFDTLPISKTVPFQFENEEAVREILKTRELDVNLDAHKSVAALKKYYNVKEGHTAEDVRRIVGVRYEMEQRLFSTNNPYTFAFDVPVDIITKIKEKHAEYPGVEIYTDYIRDYAYDSLASHILGRVGIIYRDEYELLKDKDYGMNDIIGKDGMEKHLESYLKGKAGQSSVIQTIEGKTAGVLMTKAPVPGNDVFLTIDANLQQVLENSLKNTINSLSASGANAGSAVVIDVNTGEILAMASYPTYNIETFNDDYNNLLKNPDNPMWNRAVSGQYAPGSTYKILTAIAALESGTITPNETIVDEGRYNFYASSGYAPVCWIYSQSGKTHGPQNVTSAIENSCNYYFYEVGRKMGIDTLEEYSKRFGFGDYTGVEYLGESKGTLASREFKESVIEEQWYPGDTLQSAIGQSYHMFTPIQLANYIATVANGGTRYKTQMVKSVINGATGNLVKEFMPEIAFDIDMDEENYKAVINGMKKVSETGTASTVFADFGVQVGGKTGTADVSVGAPTGLFVAFAPFDNPQIAISVVIEHGAHGNSVAPVARDVIEAYMKSNTKDDLFMGYNGLVK